MLSQTSPEGGIISNPESIPAWAPLAAPAPEAPSAEAIAPPVGSDPYGPPPVAPRPPKRRRIFGWIIAIVLLFLALVAALVVIWLALQRIDDAEQEIKEQQELIDKKETFAAEMSELVAITQQFDGALYADIVPQSRIETLAHRGWLHRWDNTKMDLDSDDVRQLQQELTQLLAAAKDQAAVNATGTAYEATLDQLGGGFVATVVGDADGFCQHGDVLGCVSGEDPYLVHIDAADTAQPWMTDFIQTGVAYHEFAHVLQFTNPEATDKALEAFGGDFETMADCYSLTTLPGWTLDHTVWVSSYEYWEVSVGYGYYCDAGQQQAIRDWIDQVGYQSAPVSQ